ncbi:VirB4 family type IV secretion system protein [Hutsoniella sourekii]|uniref:VirB4 family type IV secretion system protein n=1 Tax=Hutsoniella sourekii TaxID=87650 RepID=UPI000486D0D4|nr:DUF87 domain-containing protein [Hutsoniella sourekii]
MTNKKDNFVYETQPIGNLRFLDSIIQTGNAVMTTLYIYAYPGEPVGLWQSFLHNIPNSFVMVDIANQESGEVLQKLQRAIREQYGRMIEEKEAYEKMIAQEEYQDLTYLGKAIRQNVEIMKYFTARIILFAETRDELEKRVTETRKQLEKQRFGATVLLLEQKEEYLSMFLNHTTQTYLPNKRIGRDISSSHVATTFPANHVFLHDERGQHLGYSLTGGNIIFDCFELDGSYRSHYNLLVLGEMGSGKSTLMKKILVNLASKGYVLRGFDKSGEYQKTLNFLDAKSIALDGSDGVINIFQIFPTVVNEATNQVDQLASFTQHKSKLATWYNTVKPKVTDTELDIFELAINAMYERFNFDTSNERTNFTERNNKEYPILTDLISTIEGMQSSNDLSEMVKINLEKIELTLKKLNASYGQLFNGHTTIENLQDEQVLFFNIDGLMSLDNKPIIDAQMFSALNLIWATLINNGKEQARLYAKKEIRFEDIKRSMLIIDEAHNQINANNPRQTRFINTMQREGRKLYVGVMLATQSLTTLAPEVITSEASELLRDVYNFSQYRFFFKISAANLPHLKRLSQNDITQGQIERIGLFQQGRCLMSISGGNNIEFDVEVSNRELELFSGGGRNVEDMK